MLYEFETGGTLVVQCATFTRGERIQTPRSSRKGVEQTMSENQARNDSEDAGVSGGQNLGKAALIVNTRSRTGERAFFRAIDILQELEVPLGVTYAIRDPARLAETVRQVLDDGYTFLILGGGDGTVSSVVDFLVDGDAVLGLLPLGTANDFARTLDIPESIEDACKTIAQGKVVDIDLGLAGDNFYVNVASVGLGVEATRALSPWLKKSTGPLAYPVAAISAFLKHKPFSATLTFPDGDHETVEYDRLLQVAIGNGRFYGGGMIVASESGIDDKTLDIYAVDLGRHRDLIGAARYLKSGDFIKTDGVHHFRTSRVRLETGPELPVNIDGEVVTRTPQDFSVAHNALDVIVPQESAAASHDE
jgi:diacylglycerol kinase (ATP)